MKTSTKLIIFIGTVVVLRTVFSDEIKFHDDVSTLDSVHETCKKVHKYMQKEKILGRDVWAILGFCQEYGIPPFEKNKEASIEAYKKSVCNSDLAIDGLIRNGQDVKSICPNHWESEDSEDEDDVRGIVPGSGGMGGGMGEMSFGTF